MREDLMKDYGFTYNEKNGSDVYERLEEEIGVEVKIVEHLAIIRVEESMRYDGVRVVWGVIDVEDLEEWLENFDW